MSSKENLQSLNRSHQLSDGKATPVMSLLLNYKPERKVSMEESRSRGGQSPRVLGLVERWEEELSFNAGTIKSDATNDAADDDSDLEVLVSDCSSRDSDDGEGGKLHLVGSAIGFTPCLRCTGAAPNELLMQPSAINEMCHKLCSDDCRLGLSLTGFVPKHRGESSPPIHSKILQPLSNYDNSEALHKDRSFKSSEVGLVCKELTSTNDVLGESDNQSFDSNEPSGLSENRYGDTSGQNAFGSLDIEMLTNLGERFDIIEALARSSSMTSAQVKQRLVARKLELDLHNFAPKNVLSACVHQEGNAEGSCAVADCGRSNALNDLTPFSGKDYEPPREFLQFLLRMGSFNSAPKIHNVDSQDDGFEIPKGLNAPALLQHIRKLRGENLPPLLTRYFLKPLEDRMVAQEISDGLRYLKLESNNEARQDSMTSPNYIRLLQWNILSQSLGQNNDGFVDCPEEALCWHNRKFLIVQEILQPNPDLVCLQEVDHFKFLQNMLATQNYEGFFFPKPDSPCLYIGENNGPDGCAIFYKRDKFELINFDTRVLEVWHVQSNQIAIAANFRIKGSGKEICVCTTHLKARQGALLSKLRNEQGRDLIYFANSFADGRPLLLCGDFNAEPVEPVYLTILSSDILNLSSAYADIKYATEQDGGKALKQAPVELFDKVASSIAREPPYTTWKIREDGEICHTIDYVFYTSDYLEVKNCLEFPQGNEIGKNRTPSIQYPSDHFSLVCDFKIVQ